MATSMVPPAVADVTGGTADTRASILADLNSGDTGSTDNTGAVDTATADEISSIPGDEEEVPVIEAAEQQTPEQQQQATEDDSEKPNIENLDLSRWQRVHKGYKYTQELGRALGVVGEDGRVDLTLFPPIDEITGMRSAYSDRIAMEHDFSSGDPANAETFIQNWNRFSPEGMATMAARMPDVLAQGNTNAYIAMAAPVLNRFLDHMYRAPGVEPELRQRLLDAARLTEWWMNSMPAEGGYRSDADIQTATRAPQVDPREQQLAARERQIRDHEQRSSAAQWDGFAGSTNTRIKTAVDAELDKALAPLKPMYPNQISYEAVRERFHRQFQQTLASDKMAQRQFEVAIERARRTRSAEDQESLVSQYMTMARRALHTIRGTFITQASQGIKQNSDARHQTLQRSASKVGATSAAAPRPQGVTPKLEPRRKDETSSEFQHRSILADLA